MIGLFSSSRPAYIARAGYPISDPGEGRVERFVPIEAPHQLSLIFSFSLANNARLGLDLLIVEEVEKVEVKYIELHDRPVL